MLNKQKSFLDRNLDHYPPGSQRIWYLALSVAATIVLYYESYVLPAVVPLVLATFHFSFSNYVTLILFSNFLGALSSLIGSLSDRIGRANLIVYGVLLTAVITLLIAFTTVGWIFIVLSLALGFIEGIILVATPAIVRDFSPRLGRATAMAFWTIGPVGGSVLATLVPSLTIGALVTWQSQYIIAALVSLVVSLLCFFSLRDLSPALRSQIMTTLQERALLEARARGIDVEHALRNPWRQMLQPRILVSALGISLFLLLYFASVAYFPTYYNVIFKYPLPLANALIGIYWLVDAAASIVSGIISDRLEVRKPFMLFGALSNMIVLLIFISRIGQPTSPVFMGILSVFFGLTGPVAYVGWMAGYTETLEDINPALVATGIAVWGFLIRAIVVLSTLGFGLTVTDTHNAGQWEIWWWVCLAGILVFIPTIFLATGYWSPARARRETKEKIQAEGLAVE